MNPVVNFDFVQKTGSLGCTTNFVIWQEERVPEGKSLRKYNLCPDLETNNNYLRLKLSREFGTFLVINGATDSHSNL